MSTTTVARSSASATLTTPLAREVARACLDGLQALAPTRPSTEIHPVVHRAAQRSRRPWPKASRSAWSSTRWSA
jgi:hypothetical protein